MRFLSWALPVLRETTVPKRLASLSGGAINTLKCAVFTLRPD
jgi:hypothetical protein